MGYCKYKLVSKSGRRVQGVVTKSHAKSAQKVYARQGKKVFIKKC